MSFPDVNVWLALLMEDHVHHTAARQWWNRDQSDVIGFSRFTQVSLLRLLTTPPAMKGKPLTMREAWNAYDRLFEDDRVSLLPEPQDLEAEFRKLSSASLASPKLWADAYLLAFAARANGTLITFDRAFDNREVACLVLP